MPIIQQLTGKANKFQRDLLSKQLLTGGRTWGEGMKDNKIIFCICKLKEALYVCAVFLFGFHCWLSKLDVT